MVIDSIPLCGPMNDEFGMDSGAHSMPIHINPPGPSMNTLKKSQSNVDCKHPCVYQYGSCSFGDDCRFAEVDGKVCAKFLKGGCSWGSACCWRHPQGQPRGVKGPDSRRSNQRRDPRRDVGSLEDTFDEQRVGLVRLQQIQMQQGLPPALLTRDMPTSSLPTPSLMPSQMPQSMLHGMHDSSEQEMKEHVLMYTRSYLQSAKARIKLAEERHEQRVRELQSAIDQVDQEQRLERLAHEEQIRSLSATLDSLCRQCDQYGLSSQSIVEGTLPQSFNPPRQESRPKPTACQRCGATGPQLMLCGGCKQAAFCGEECQRAGWAEHSKECKK